MLLLKFIQIELVRYFFDAQYAHSMFNDSKFGYLFIK